MVSEFRRKKLQELFDFYDIDKSGTIDKRGFEMDIELTSKIRGFTKGDSNHKYFQDTLLKIWDGVRKDGDADNDGKVTAEEWISLWDRFAKNPSSPLEWQISFCNFVFYLLDVNNDKIIDIDEFVSVNEGFGIPNEVILATFKKLSKGKQSISYPEFQELWKDYFTSDDPKDIGNSIFCSNL